ncbi:DUF6266 family protein [Pedobacter metabolipauper]|uniref:Uncharacterized protein n=1 Tax=Pedobacter metabolipauper TaxID=425513 RepID=A0A4V3D125_9SPHI|nr:DUF6266 family protein [Pedobacter metabolipauper]TDQ08754.1 hypothetical protein ATK78_3272 [Pedobacter metabolipauper]
MAKAKNGIFGSFSGKVGNIVGSMWKSISTIRKAPKKKTKKEKARKPRTEAQLAATERFVFVSKWLVPFHEFINVGFLNIADNQTEINLCHSETMKNAITGVYQNLGIDYSKVIISKGKLAPLEELTVTLTEPNTVELNWKMSYPGGAKFNDQLMLAIYCPEFHETEGFIGGITRARQKCSFTFRNRLIGKELHVYVGVTAMNRKKIANSVYLGTLKPSVD